jgi:16S rRNA (guanine(966)-N(2))-methyltransferase RsmD
MRIITGKFKGRPLATVDGKTTRPTTDYNRELIFSVYSDYEAKQVLDLYAGTGSFGLEALSRGAEFVDFVEFASKAIGVLLKNVNTLGCTDLCHVHRRRAEQYVKDCSKRYDVIFMDPPYKRDLVNTTLKQIFEMGILKADGIVIVEHSRLEPISAEFQDLIIKEKTGKITSFTLLSYQN